LSRVNGVPIGPAIAKLVQLLTPIRGKCAQLSDLILRKVQLSSNRRVIERVETLRLATELIEAVKSIPIRKCVVQRASEILIELPFELLQLRCALLFRHIRIV